MESGNTPSICIREFTQNDNRVPFENTSTVVLTSRSGYFVDLRILLPANGAALPNEGGPPTSLPHASAGTFTTEPVPIQTSSAPRPTHALRRNYAVHHTLPAATAAPDARTHANTTPSPPPRTSPTTPTAPTSPNTTSPTPRSGRPGSASHRSRHRRRPHPSPPRQSVVLALSDPSRGVSGLVIRVGHLCQGVLAAGGGVTAERFLWSADARGDGGGGGWKRVVRVGDLFLPCAVALQAECLGEGMVVRYGEYRWVVLEVMEW
ncbi:hypothetical protein H2203_007250 [Taxawa tesnikishii (nom. ined.)]|nr:hypothetical protein H2203_007250 [Dothideales sp. JES 119]